MSESSPIKDALYAKIDGIGQEQIHQLLLNNKFSELFEIKKLTSSSLYVVLCGTGNSNLSPKKNVSDAMIRYTINNSNKRRAQGIVKKFSIKTLHLNNYLIATN